jgi:DUF1680 family protein
MCIRDRRYNDSDVYKVLEGAAYSLMHHRDKELEAEVDSIIELIEDAQQDDGYILNYYVKVKPDEKWTDMDSHEMYSMGHMMEAAVAYFKATGKRKLLDVAIRAADHIDNTFGEGKRHWVPGHEEIEVGLMKLYQVTGEKKYFDLAYWLLEERGQGYGLGTIWNNKHWGPAYCQDDVPVKDIERVMGHSVRAMYLFMGMADVEKEYSEADYSKALDNVWDNIVNKNMYITGGIGSSQQNEGFTTDYDLPNKTAYCETCASVGMVMWNHRMNMLYGDSKYADVVERAMYNGVLSGVSLDGTKFFYDNVLESDGDKYRKEWFDTSCCPTQICRFVPSVGGYIYAIDDSSVWINQYIQSETELDLAGKKVVVSQQTNYPWEGVVKVKAQCEDGINIKLRIPDWCKSFRLNRNSQIINNIAFEKGYALIENVGSDDEIVIIFDMPVECVGAHPSVVENKDKVAICRGPLVYCVEQVDNDNAQNVYITNNTKFNIINEDHELGNITRIMAINGDDRYSLVPYHLWANRNQGWMKVWLPYESREELYSS